MNGKKSDLPEFLSLIGKKHAVETIETTWQRLTAPAKLLKPTLEVNRLPESMALPNMPFEFASIYHAPGIGEVLLKHLKTECAEQLGLSIPDIYLSKGYYFEPS